MKTVFYPLSGFLLLWLAAANLLAFSLFGIDKLRARRGEWRIPERTLFLAPLLGGSAGGLLGMWVFHHKTRHARFRYGLPLLLLLQLGVWWLFFR